MSFDEKKHELKSLLWCILYYLENNHGVEIDFWLRQEQNFLFFSLILFHILYILAFTKDDTHDIFYDKVEKILKGSLDKIPSPSMKIQIMGGKVCLRCRGKTLLHVVNKFLKTKSLLTTPSNVPFPPIIWIFTEGDSDEI